MCVSVCEHVEGIKVVMQDYPAGRLPTSSAEEEMERQRRRWRTGERMEKKKESVGGKS